MRAVPCIVWTASAEADEDGETPVSIPGPMPIPVLDSVSAAPTPIPTSAPTSASSLSASAAVALDKRRISLLPVGAGAGQGEDGGSYRRCYLQSEAALHGHPIWRKQGFWETALQDGTFQQLDLLCVGSAGGNDGGDRGEGVGGSSSALPTVVTDGPEYKVQSPSEAGVGGGAGGGQGSSLNAAGVGTDALAVGAVQEAAAAGGLLWDELNPELLRETVVSKWCCYMPASLAQLG